MKNLQDCSNIRPYLVKYIHCTFFPILSVELGKYGRITSLRNVEQKYKRRREYYEILHKKQSKIINIISNIRLLAFAAAVTLAILAFTTGYPIIYTALAAVALIIFIYLVIRHDKFINNRKYSIILSGINTDSLKRLQGEWSGFADDGRDFSDDGHPFSQDLDIFGSRSLFQMINTAVTFKGRLLLKNMLAGKPGTAETISLRQEAIAELAGKLAWRQRFQAEALNVSKEMNNPESLIEWAADFEEQYRKPWVIAAIRLIPAVTLILCVLSFALHLIPFYIPVILLFAQLASLSVKKKNRYKTFAIADSYADDLRVYYKMLCRIEKTTFVSEYLMNIKNSMNSKGGLTPSKQLDKLSRIIDSMSNRHTPFYIIFNTFALWDYQNMVSLAKWKQNCGSCVQSWLDAAAAFEALSSLAILNHDNPEWSKPSFAKGNDTVFEAKKLGHPLIASGRIRNDLHIINPEKVLLITGSNMSGKSTLLRTAGINLVLAYAGAAVCAETFHASIMDIYTCIRVSDNLGKSISSFYAELLRIKEIVNAAALGGKIFFLLDEIFKGTNSRDRHTGARVLISKLSGTAAIGLVSTHDLELCSLEDENKRIRNYHFQEYYKDGSIHFDYMLRLGASTTSNAIYLMKMAGIDV